jgi:hypothetical protein
MQPNIPEFLKDIQPGWRVVMATAFRIGDDQPPFGVSYDDLLEDFIVVHSDDLDISLEIDWLPERSPSGQFTLTAIDFSMPDRLADSYAKPLRTFTTRSLRQVIEEMRRWMSEFTANGKSASQSEKH